MSASPELGARALVFSDGGPIRLCICTSEVVSEPNRPKDHSEWLCRPMIFTELLGMYFSMGGRIFIFVFLIHCIFFPVTSKTECRSLAISAFWSRQSEMSSLREDVVLEKQRQKVAELRGTTEMIITGNERLKTSAIVAQRRHIAIIDGTSERDDGGHVATLNEEIRQSKAEEELVDEVTEEAYQVDVNDLHEARIVEFGGEELSTDVEWDTVLEKVELYRSRLAKTWCLCDPLYYLLVDHSGFHGPTSDLLKDYLPHIRHFLPKEMCFTVPTFSEEEADFFDLLIMADDVDDIVAVTSEQKRAKKLVSKMIESVIMPMRNYLSEVEHMMRNVVPLMDATVALDKRCWVRYGEKSLEATAARRNKGSDPNKRARVGYKVDTAIEYQELDWAPVIGCVEISGGLPRCSRSKEWDDTLKLGLELRDLWVFTEEQLVGVDTTHLVFWGLTVVARTIRIYALAALGGLFHLVLVHEASLPSSREDLINVELAYLTLMGFKEKLEATIKELCNLNRKRVVLMARGKRKDMSGSPKRGSAKKPKIICTPN
ncbi:hypothetical protein BC936DRAFT_145021 [Jimgerdemannia flammicorona]|uniref:Uncharacterized protein n=1 Tax=Jimgerdemannia flammicorona TaxID=994334 RepID=A0A433DB42_9FUNG|nr:hypothetical protein BC936DRAFT_145021 [Jimgerdemannia flammicorona]